MAEFAPISAWAEDDRPREKLLARGAGALTDAELLAIILGTGAVVKQANGSVRKLSAVDLGRELAERFGGLQGLARASANEIMQTPGIGPAKAISILTAFELARRKQLIETREFIVSSSESVAAYLTPRVVDLPHEAFYALYLNRKNKLIGEKQIATGGVAGVAVDVKLLFKEALTLLASSLIVCHNHPSGNPRPSEDDFALTRQIREAARLLDMRLLDHIIVAGDRSYYSFADAGLLS